jgi:hypothetical protein
MYQIKFTPISVIHVVCVIIDLNKTPLTFKTLLNNVYAIGSVHPVMQSKFARLKFGRQMLCINETVIFNAHQSRHFPILPVYIKLRANVPTGPMEIEVLDWKNHLHLSLSLSLSVAPTLEHRASVKRFVSLQFLNPKTVGRTPRTGDQPIARPLPTQTQNKHRYTSMPRVGFEPTIPVFERAKTIHASDRAATVIGICICSSLKLCRKIQVWHL